MKMKTVYKDRGVTRMTLKSLGGDGVMEERVSEEEFFEIQKLKDGSVMGEHIEWEKLKKELSV
ncbi:MAG: hypothetical protein EF813_11190 [Methanosarcinales archaeon]|nr:MAG: hypothetical protein EF813_11190 [Methanosarcinales archaeon]